MCEFYIFVIIYICSVIKLDKIFGVNIILNVCEEYLFWRLEEIYFSNVVGIFLVFILVIIDCMKLNFILLVK